MKLTHSILTASLIFGASTMYAMEEEIKLPLISLFDQSSDDDYDIQEAKKRSLAAVCPPPPPADNPSTTEIQTQKRKSGFDILPIQQSNPDHHGNSISTDPSVDIVTHEVKKALLRQLSIDMSNIYECDIRSYNVMLTWLTKYCASGTFAHKNLHTNCSTKDIMSEITKEDGYHFPPNVHQTLNLLQCFTQKAVQHYKTFGRDGAIIKLLPSDKYYMHATILAYCKYQAEYNTEKALKKRIYSSTRTSLLWIPSTDQNHTKIE